ncbi:MAG: Smr/MutS family protein [Rikenellaceae bacterium]
MILVGDRVKFISDTYVGEVVKIKGLIAEVEVEDGFVVPTMLSDLVVVNKEDEMDAMRRMGGPDNRPGTNKGSKQKPEKKNTPHKREAAYLKYGKVSLVDDDEDEDDIINISDLKAMYAKTVANINAKETEVFEKENPKPKVAKVVIEEPKTPESEPTPEPAKEKPQVVSLESLGSVLKMKGDKPSAPKAKKAAPKNDMEVVDLHAEEILESTAGMTSGEILQAQLTRFNIALSLNVNNGKHGKMVFIHGVGSGKLKYELQRELARKYPKLSYQDASFKEYGYGAIMIFY